MGSRELLQQVFYNLMNNAIKFSSAGRPPRIAITGRVRESSSSKMSPFTEIVFADNGIGFDNAFAQDIFKSFTRLNGKNEYEGTGLGLSLCKKIIERLNGTIEAHGTPGHGAKFTIVLPAFTSQG